MIKYTCKENLVSNIVIVVTKNFETLKSYNYNSLRNKGVYLF